MASGSQKGVNPVKVLAVFVALIASLIVGVPAFAADPGQEGIKVDRPSWIIYPV